MADNSALKSCPFCGAPVTMHYTGSSDWTADCSASASDCGASVTFWIRAENEPAEAARRWNRRAHLQQRPLPVREGTDDGCVVHHLAHPCEACAVESAHEQEARRLHGAIMNLPCRVPFPLKEEPEEARAYQRGHKDARHAAAEMVLAAASSPSVQNMGEGETGKDGVNPSHGSQP